LFEDDETLDLATDIPEHPRQQRTDVIRRFQSYENTTKVATQTSPQHGTTRRTASEDKPPKRPLTPKMIAWTNFATGGHALADQRIAEDRLGTAEKTKLKRMDDDMMKGLFGDDYQSESVGASAAVTTLHDEDDDVPSLNLDPFTSSKTVTPHKLKRSSPQKTRRPSLQQGLIEYVQETPSRRRTKVVSEYIMTQYPVPTSKKAEEQSLLD
jgi:hypothetical protein